MRTWDTIIIALVVATCGPSARAEVPSNGWVIWASTRDGPREIYRMRADGSGVKRLTYGGGAWGAWSPTSKWIGYTRNGTSRVVHPDGSGDKKVCDGRFLFWMHDGSGLVCDINTTYYLVHPDTGAKKVLFRKSDYPDTLAKLGGGENFRPTGITHDGKYILLMGSYDGTVNLINRTQTKGFAAMVQDRYKTDKLYLFGDGCEPDAPASGDLIYHVCGDGPCSATYPDIYRMSIKDLATRSSYQAEVVHADADWGHEYFPRVSNDNKWLVYGATTGCHPHATCDYEIFVHRLGAAKTSRQRITTSTANDTWPDLYVGNLWQAPKPALALSPTALSFSVQQDQANPAAKTVAVSNSGAGTLGTVSTSVVYGSGSGWLTVNRSGSGNSQTLSNQVNIAGLTPNTYTATVKVSESGASNSPRSYAVTLTVTPKPQPKLKLNPTTVTFSAQEGSGVPAPKSVSVTNSGTGTLAAVGTSIVYGSGSGWLTVAKSGSGNSQSLSNEVSISGLSPNTYTATVKVTSGGAVNSPQSYTVSLTVTAKPKTDPDPLIVLDPTNVSFVAQQGGSAPASKAVDVSNGGGKTLAQVSPSITYTSGDGWLDVSPTGSGNSQQLDNHVTIAGLVPDTYSATVKVSASGANNSPQNYTVSLTVTSKPEPALALSPASLDVNATAGSSDPLPQTIAVTNSGSATLSPIATSTSYAGSSTGWLEVKTLGSGNDQSLENSFSIAGLEPNTYSATVEVVSSGAVNSPQNYAVTLIVASGSGSDDAGVGNDAGTGVPDGGVDSVLVTPSDTLNNNTSNGLVLEGGCSVSPEGRAGGWSSRMLLILLVLACGLLRRKT